VAIEVLVSAGADGARHVGQRDEGLGHRAAVVGGDEDVEVADVVAVAPRAARERGVDHARDLAQAVGDALGDRQGVDERDAAGPSTRARTAFDRLAQVLRRLLPHAGKVGDATVLERGAQAVEVGHPELAGEQLHPLGTEAGDLEQVTLPDRVLLAQRLELGDGAAVSTYSRIFVAVLLPSPRTSARCVADMLQRRPPTGRPPPGPAFW
jgi:hypothetical protein